MKDAKGHGSNSRYGGSFAGSQNPRYRRPATSRAFDQLHAGVAKPETVGAGRRTDFKGFGGHIVRTGAEARLDMDRIIGGAMAMHAKQVLANTPAHMVGIVESTHGRKL
jgi:hypothetical protein